jgi:hypothetical protein
VSTATILLALTKGLDRPIHQGVRNLSTEQKPHTCNKNPTIQNHCSRKRTPLHTDSPGSDHRTAQISGIRCNINHCGPWLFTGHHLLPCNATITGPQIAQLHYKYIYPWFGLPNKVISDRDPHFTSHFGRALAKELGITWNMSTA